MISLGHTGIGIFYTQKHIVAMDINHCGFYGNIFIMFCVFLTYSNVTERLVIEYSLHFQGTWVCLFPILISIICYVKFYSHSNETQKLFNQSP